MSDCFNHCLDAYEDLYARGEEESRYGAYGRGSRTSHREQTYYDLSEIKTQYKVKKFVKLCYETLRAKLFSDGYNEYWIPKSKIRNSWEMKGKKRPIRVEVDCDFELKPVPVTLWS